MIAHQSLRSSRRAALPHRAPTCGWQIAVATSPEGWSRMPPEPVPKALQRCPVTGRAVAAEVTGQDGAQRLPRLGDGSVIRRRSSVLTSLSFARSHFTTVCRRTREASARRLAGDDR